MKARREGIALRFQLKHGIRSPIFSIGLFICLLVMVSLSCRPPEKQPPPATEYVFTILDGHNRAVESMDVGQVLLVGVKAMKPNESVRVTLRDEGSGKIISYYQLTSSRKGEIEPSVLWYHTGVIDERTPRTRKLFEYEFTSFEEAEKALAGRSLIVSVESREGSVLNRQRLPVNSIGKSKNPLVYFSTRDGLLRNSYDVSQDKEMYLTVKNLQGVSNLQVMLVPNRYGWRPEMPLAEVRKAYAQTDQIVKLERAQTSITIPLGPVEALMRGSYDVIIRPDPDRFDRILRPRDIIGGYFGPGIILQFAYSPPWAPFDFDIAGRPDKNWGYPYFEFHDIFKVGEEMWGAVDPAILPMGHPSGRYAAYYVINHGSAGGMLVDETEAIEIVPVMSGCINCNMVRIWNTADEGEYDVVVDFGSTTAMTQGDYAADNAFNGGVDFIDRSMNVGAYVVNDPALPGSFTPVAYSYQPASANPNDPLRTDVSAYFNSPDASVTETMNNVPLRAVGYYPSGAGPFPLVLIAHGNHTATHPSHTGYDYLCQLLASHGIIAMSIDENFLNGYVSGEMDARAIVMLRHLQRWRTWNGTMGHTFFNKVDLTKIGLAGHSRGGEAITVANLFNTTLHNAGDVNHNFDFSIKALYAIAPVDGQIGTGVYAGTPVVVNTADYFIMHGSHDGDVFNFGGLKTYDRAFPLASMAGGYKGLLFVYGANHNYWNTEWASHSNDGTAITSPLAQITPAQQQSIGKVYVSAFFQASLKGKEPYKALFAGDVRFDSFPANITLIHQYSDKERVDLNNYQEDSDPLTGSFAGVTNAANALNPYLDTDITGNWDWGAGMLNNPYFTWNQTRGLIVGWNNPAARYEISVPPAVGALVNTYPYLSLRIGQVFESPVDLNPAGANKDLSLQLELGATIAHSLKVTNFDDLPYPVQTAWYGQPATKSNMKTVRIPLRAFTVNQSSWNLTALTKIKLSFDQTATGRVVIDDIQLTK